MKHEKTMILNSKIIYCFATLVMVLSTLIMPFSAIRAEADVTKPTSAKFTETGVKTYGYIRVNMPNHPNEWMISSQFKDSHGNIGYCLDSELPSPTGSGAGSLKYKGAGSDEFYRMFKGGFPSKTAKELGAGNDTEAWYATQLVSWVLAGNFKVSQIVWSHPNHTAAETARVKKAFEKIYDYAKNGKDTPNTEFSITASKTADEGKYHTFTYKTSSNKTGNAKLTFTSAKPAGMKIYDADGKEITNNTVKLNSSFTIKVPVTTPSGTLSFKGTANVSTTNPFTFDGRGVYQDAVVMITTSETKDSKSLSAKWTRAVGQVTVKKVDQDGNALKGAEFTLTDNNNAKSVKTTGDDGLATFDLQQGLTYSLEETKVPEGYQGSFKKDGITVNTDGQEFSYTATNTIKKGKIKVKKVDQDGKPLANAEFTLTDDSSQTQAEKTDENGLASFDIVANKTYSLEETGVPTGYTGAFKQEGITVKDDGQTFEYTATNTLKKGVVKVHKVDQDGKPLENAEFTLTDEKGATQVEKTDENGLASFNIVANKTYSLEETGVPVGYTGAFKQEGITVKDDGQTFEYTATNTLKKGVVKVHKVDQDGKPLANAEFTLTDEKGEKEVKTTDEAGLATFNIVANRTYSLEETKVPTGYTGSFKQEDITIKDDGQVFEYTATNTLKKGVIKVHKVDDQGKALANAEFTLTDDQGEKVVQKTDKDGLATFNIVANKTYKIEETQNPNGYTGKWSKEGITVVDDGQTFEYTVINHRVPETVRTGGIGTSAFLLVFLVAGLGMGLLYYREQRKVK
ncbi:Cys-Gln thioester bond-forming surface protein [Enterococcus faecium]